MAGYRKLSRTSDQRKALIRDQVTGLLHHGKIVATEARAKEVHKIAESSAAVVARERNSFETVKVVAKVARKDKDGKRVREVVNGKKVTVYDEVEREIKKDLPSRLHARRQILKVLCNATGAPTTLVGKRKSTKSIDMPAELFDGITPKYTSRNGGYTRIVKISQRKDDGTTEVVLELV